MKLTNKYDLPMPFFKSIERNTYSGSMKDGDYSATDLTKSPKQVLLYKRHYEELEEDAMDRLWSYYGTLGHEALSRIKKYGMVAEKRFTIQVSNSNLSGQPDLLWKKEEILYDYKFTSVWSYIFAPESGKIEWEKQLNVYAYLLRVHGFKVSIAQIIMVLKDWSARDAKYKADYPKVPVMVQNIRLWDDKEQESFINTEIRKLETFSEMSDDDIPVCSEADRWAKPSTWAVYKGTNKTATKVCSSEQEAELVAESLPSPRIEHRPGTDTKCTSYCSVCDYCNYYKLHYGQDELAQLENVPEGQG